jgi:hypothetical protein
MDSPQEHGLFAFATTMRPTTWSKKTSLSLYMYYKKKTLSFIILFRLVKMQQDSLTIKHEVVVAMSLNAASAHHTLL